MKDQFEDLNNALNTASDIVKEEPKELKILKTKKSGIKISKKTMNILEVIYIL